MKTCIKCGSNEFYDSGDCKECARARARRRREEKPDVVKAEWSAWKAANKERYALVRQVYRNNNKETQRKADADWYQNNIEYAKQRVRDWGEKNTEKKKEAAKAYREKNAKVLAKKSSEWAKANPDRVNKKNKRWRDANTESIKLKNARWAAANKDLLKTYKHNRRARIVGNGGSISRGLENVLLARQKGKCACCLVSVGGKKYHLDHILPLALGGENTDNNIQILCPSCNLQKSAKHPIVFMQSKGFLL